MDGNLMTNSDGLFCLKMKLYIFPAFGGNSSDSFEPTSDIIIRWSVCGVAISVTHKGNPEKKISLTPVESGGKKNSPHTSVAF